MVSAPLDVKAHGSTDFGPYFMLAKKPTGDPGEMLLSGYIATYDADLADVLTGHSHGPGAPVCM